MPTSPFLLRCLLPLDDLRKPCSFFAYNAVTAARFVVRANETVDASSSVLRLGPQGFDVGRDYGEAARVLPEQCEAATRLAALRLADSENAQQDVVVAPSTNSRLTLALGHTRD